MRTDKISAGEWRSVFLAAVAAFSVYTCMYAIRKPFTSATFDGFVYLGISYKSWLVVAQTIGYTVSKFYGISFIGSLKDQKNGVIIIILISVAWLALLGFALVPAPYNIIFLLINGLPLGVIYGLVFRYLEGRKSTEFLGAALASSFIFASGFTQSAGRLVMIDWGFSEWWMPFITGLIFFPVLLFSTWLLARTPLPDSTDIAQRTQRKAMDRWERRSFVRRFLPGLFLLTLAYIMLTIVRDYRSNFAADMWNELGYGGDASVFTRSEVPASLIVLVVMSLLIFVRSNIRALLINHLLIFIGFVVVICSTMMYSAGIVSPFWWITLSGVGLYMAYVPFNCMLFERLISTFRYAGNAGFIIYLADSFGYLGSDVIIICRNLLKVEVSWTAFFVRMMYVFSSAGLVLVLISAIYFRKKVFEAGVHNPKQKSMAGNAIVVGAGIAGLAVARALAVRGYTVDVFERNGMAAGASIRNFGMIWPIGQTAGRAYEAALKSRLIWEDICREAGIWFESNGSLHLAYREDEWNVLQELKEACTDRELQLLTPQQVRAISSNAITDALKGGLYSATEMIVDPREAIAKIPWFLTGKYGVRFHWNEPVKVIDLPAVETGIGGYEADEVFVCSGIDFETLYPELFSQSALTKCKLQMMRLSAQEKRMGPALCGALSLGHYKSFEAASSLPLLKKRFEEEFPLMKKFGIHVMLSQNEAGEFTLGDSHEYGRDPSPFDNAMINELILGYLRTFAGFKHTKVIESWNGVYAKLMNGDTHLLLNPEKGLTILNGFGGAGMTLAFGVAENIVASI